MLNEHFGAPGFPGALVDGSRLVSRLRTIWFPLVLTTNYDTVLEQIWPGAPVLDIQTAADTPFLSLSGRDRSEPPVIVKLHGTWMDGDVATVTMRDYQYLFSERAAMQDVLGRVCEKHSLWFLGYSMNDVDVQAALSMAQARYPLNQHFCHKWEFVGDEFQLDRRVDHIRYNIRSFALRPQSLFERVDDLHRAMTFIRRKTNHGISLLRSDNATLGRAMAVLSRHDHQMPGPVQDLARSWLDEIHSASCGFLEPLHDPAWERVLRAEAVLRDALFVWGMVEERRTLAGYIFDFRRSIPQAHRIFAADCLAEGLGYVQSEPHEARNALDAALALRGESAATQGRLDALTLARIYRTAYKFNLIDITPGGVHSRETLLDLALDAAAEAASPAYSSALLLDAGLASVQQMLRGDVRAGTTANIRAVHRARSALELALVAGSYRRVAIALQRLAILDVRNGHRWLGHALAYHTNVSPVERRSKLYLDLTKAVVLAREGRARSGLGIIAEYNEPWLLEHGLFGDAGYLSTVATYVRSYTTTW